MSLSRNQNFNYIRHKISDIKKMWRVTIIKIIIKQGVERNRVPHIIKHKGEGK